MLKGGSTILSKQLYTLTIGGGVVFWTTTIATSLLPIAAEYRASFSNRSWNIQAVWVGSLLASLIIGGCVSYSLLRLLDQAPTKNAVLASTILGFAALFLATTLIDVPRTLLGPSEGWYYFVIGILLNAPRFLALGMSIGYLYQKRYGST
jgi:hypothetical protein